jgi:hypothetical protein
MSTVMEMRVETERFVPHEEHAADDDLADGAARAERRPAWYAAVVVLDAAAILAFVTWVVVPRLT